MANSLAVGGLQLGGSSQSQDPNSVYNSYLTSQNPSKTGGLQLGPQSQDPSNGALPEYLAGSGYQIPGVVSPTQSPLAQSIYQNQLGSALDYNKNTQQTAQNLYNNYAQGTQQQLRSGISQNRDSFNSRGLLNSGAEQGGELGLKSQANINNANAASAINSGVQQNASGLLSNTFGSAAQMAQPGPNSASGYLQGIASNIQGMNTSNAAQSQLMGNAAGGVGSLGGYGLANSIYGQQQQPSSLGSYAGGFLNNGMYGTPTQAPASNSTYGGYSNIS